MAEKKKKSVTSVDVARVAGVSQSTVSRVFNKNTADMVKPELKKHILQVAEEMCYRPNLVARGMVSGKSSIIALITGENPGPFYNSLNNAFIKSIQNRNKNCLIFQIPRQEELETILSRVLQFNVEGIIIAASAVNDSIEEVYNTGDTPVVFVNKIIPGADINSICINSFESGRSAANHLLSSNCNKIAYVKYIYESQEEREKHMGFYAEMRKNNVYVFREEYCEYKYEDGYKIGKKLFRDYKPDGIFCTSDLMALGIIDCARFEYGLQVAKDFSIVACDSIECGSYKAYKLDTLEKPVDEMVEATLNLIENIAVDSKCKNRIQMFDTKLVTRGSVGIRNPISV